MSHFIYLKIPSAKPFISVCGLQNTRFLSDKIALCKYLANDFALLNLCLEGKNSQVKYEVNILFQWKVHPGQVDIQLVSLLKANGYKDILSNSN